MQTTSTNQISVILDTSRPRENFAPGWNDQFRREQKLKILQLLWARRRFIGRCLLAGFCASILIAFSIPKEYLSIAHLMPPDSQSGGGLALMAALSGPSGGGLGAFASDLLGMRPSGALFVAVMRSRTVEDHIIGQFDLKKVYSLRWQESARKRLEHNTEITEDRKSGVITLAVTDRDRNRAAGIARTYVDELNALMSQLNTSAAHRERVFLENRLTSVKVDLEASEKDFSQFASKNGAIDISAQGRAMLEGAASLQGELIAGESDLKGLRQIYSEDNVRVRSTQARVNELRNQLAKLGGKYDTGASAGGDSASGDPYPTLRQLPILGVPYADKFRQLKVEESVFEILTKQYELAKVQEAKEIPSVKVLDSPEVPERKSFPPRLMLTLLGTMVTLTAAVLWIFGRNRWALIDPADPSLMFAQEVLGTLRSRVPWPLSKNGKGSPRESSDGANGDMGGKASH